MKKYYKISLIVAGLLCFQSIVFAGQGTQVKQATVSCQKDPNLSALKIADYICDDKFDEAEKELAKYKDINNSAIKDLAGIMEKYKQLQQRRETQRLKLYNEQIEELEKLAKQADVNGLKDTNDIAAVLSAAVKAYSYADEKEKNNIKNIAIVKKAIEKSIAKAADNQQQGQWIEAMLGCYSFLTILDPDNQEYKDHRDSLAQKALIKASLTDNPCETAAQRHKNIKKEMFIRAIMALDYNYVTVIPYSELAIKALQRCKDLAVVLNKMEKGQSISFSTDPNEMALWQGSMDEFIKEVENTVSGISRDKFLDIFEQVLKINSQSLKITPEVLIAQYSAASLAELDPHTNLIWPWYLDEFKKSMSSEFSGVGIEISKADGPLKVNSLLPDTPAFNSGIDAGDLIVAVDGEKTKDMTIECAVRKITGPEGTDVILTVRHPQEDETRDITITRARIKVRTVRSWRRGGKDDWLNMIDPNNKIGYVRITAFTSEKTADELEKQLNQLEKHNVKALILDLRFNGGGYLDQAVKVVDKFVKSGLIVSTRPRLGSFPQWEVATAKTHPDYPVIVLINGSSASASEIVAGALQDKLYKRAILVGNRTYGKGSVQTIIGYPGGGAQLKYTMAYYHLPSGQRVKNRYKRKKLHKKDWGISPDVKIELRPDEIRKLYDIQRDNAVLAHKNHDPNIAPVKRYSSEETVLADPQLEMAILVAEAKIIADNISQSVSKSKAVITKK